MSGTGRSAALCPYNEVHDPWSILLGRRISRQSRQIIRRHNHPTDILFRRTQRPETNVDADHGIPIIVLHEGPCTASLQFGYISWNYGTARITHVRSLTPSGSIVIQSYPPALDTARAHLP